MPRKTHDGVYKRCPCARRRWATCGHAWHFSFHHSGREHRYSLDVVARARGLPSPVGTTEAKAWRDRLRSEIRAGQRVEVVTAARSAALTIGDVCDRYLAGYVSPRLRPASARQAAYQLTLAQACPVPASGGSMPFAEKPLAAATKADLEAVRAARRPHGVVGCNRLLARLRHLFNWAIAEGLTETTPFKRHGVSVVKLELAAETPRDRRLAPGEADQLLARAPAHLRALIAAALSTGCRVGELLSLQWSQVRTDEQGRPQWLALPPAKTKTGKLRVLPIGARLRAELDMRRHAPDGREHPPSAYVFGDETGGRIASVKKAWETTVLRAHGHAPQWVAGKAGRLAQASREALRAIDLHFHDLRREFACTLLESRADLHDVRDFLGHANVTTTSRYLASSPVRLAAALARLEGTLATAEPRDDEKSAEGFAHDSHKAPVTAVAGESKGRIV